ncbi:T9SS type A sorting domain-containing protein [uncultured Aquimarina sp.]|uniref:T9SS type A sorting domain-containing protein n=1 Tax=uncultured Aquimarina sp. TaxID=575652 RepID=UPI002617FE0B|nr:T9SS type A sorting domain-containing protein [uncultured Aquimarina sp.]
MKKNILVIAIFLIAYTSFGQCSMENDDDQLISATPNTIRAGQSFTASCNGILNSIGILTFINESVNVTIYDGEGYSGSILGTITNQPTSPFATSSDYSFIDFSALNITLIAGQKYTFDISNLSFAIAFDNESTPDYTEGIRFSGGSPQLDSTDLLFLVNLDAIPCTDPDVPTVTHAPTTICDGDSTTLTISGNLNDATEWHIYTGSCGGMEIGTTTSATFIVTPSIPSTTYFVRGEGGLCVIPSSCGTVNVNVTANDVVSYTAPSDLCVNEGLQSGLGGGSPVGGIYTGPGVTDDGNGMTYSFNPAIAGLGTHIITYTSAGTCSDSANDTVEVFDLPTVTFTAPADLCIDVGVQNGLGGGTPTGGIYSGAGVTDDGNGTTYSFNPTTAGIGVHTITYSLTDANGCSNAASDTIEIFDIPTVTFTAPADLCINAGVQTGLSGGTATGGVYSGAGVTDNGNGMTFSFDPATAGVGIHTITYSLTDANGCSNAASDTIEVFDVPTVTFTAPADLCIDAGVQTGLNGGTPNGGIYSGAGVTDDGNGMTFSFDPATAGVGVHTITYNFTDANGCSNAASDTIEVFDVPTVTFTAPADLCIDAGVQTGLSGGTATGGVYSGTGVTDNSNGMTFSFDPATAGVGVHTITYSFTDANGCSNSASDTIEVFDVPTVTFTAPADLCIDAGVQTGLSGGTATGGVYSGTGVTDNSNGMTFSFDPAIAGVGIHTITYSFTDANGCSNSASDTIEVFDLPTVTFTAPADLCVDAGVQTALSGGTATGGVYSGTGVTDNSNGMTFSFDPAIAGVGIHTITYSFTDANGCSNSASDTMEVFDIPNASVDDSSAPTFTANTNGGFYQWINCDTDTPIIGENNQSFTATENGNYGVEITINGCTQRSSCFVVATLSTEEEELTIDQLRVYPIPTIGLINISIPIKKVTVYNIVGKKVFETLNNPFDISELSSGIYFINIEGEKGSIIKRIIKE